MNLVRLCRIKFFSAEIYRWGCLWGAILRSIRSVIPLFLGSDGAQGMIVAEQEKNARAVISLSKACKKLKGQSPTDGMKKSHVGKFANGSIRKRAIKNLELFLRFSKSSF